jgi:hypothetical protein
MLMKIFQRIIGATRKSRISSSIGLIVQTSGFATACVFAVSRADSANALKRGDKSWPTYNGDIFQYMNNDGTDLPETSPDDPAVSGDDGDYEYDGD